VDTWAWTCTDLLLRPKQWKRDVRFGTRNVRSLYRAGSRSAVAGDVARYKSDSVGVQEVRWGKKSIVATTGFLYVFFLLSEFLKHL
jgi:hypothetical protein